MYENKKIARERKKPARDRTKKKYLIGTYDESAYKRQERRVRLAFSWKSLEEGSQYEERPDQEFVCAFERLFARVRRESLYEGTEEG